MIHVLEMKRFQTTRWSLVMTTREPTPEAEAALDVLCENYWQPLYQFALSLGCSPPEAEDRVQSFFVQVLRKELFKRASPEKGKLRSFLLTTLRRHIQDEWTAQNAEKRGGDVEKVPFDERWQSEADSRMRFAFDQEWGRCVLKIALERLQQRYVDENKEELFEQLRPYLTGGRPEEGWEALAETSKLSAGALKVALHRLRKRFAEALREEVAQTLGEDEDLEEELRYLLQVLGDNAGDADE
jgi:RNA polymerase sigma-70 factor (ECF subfamily)